MLTRDNYVGYAMANLYRKPILMAELEEILKSPNYINRHLTKYKNGTSGYNLKIAINDTVSFFNIFNTGAAANLYLLLIGPQNEMLAKSIMKLIGAWDQEHDEEFYHVLLKEIQS